MENLGDIENKREAMMKRLAARNVARTLKEKNTKNKVDLGATEKAFLDTSPSSISIKTPLHSTKYSITTESDAKPSSPILSFDEKADKQMVALATWTNTMIGIENSEEMDLGTTAAEACRRIKKMLSKKSSAEAEENSQMIAARRRYQRIFEKNDSEKIKRECQRLLKDSGMEESIRNLLSKNSIAIRKELAVYSDIGLQTTLLRTFLSFHPAWLKAALETIFNIKIDAQPKFMIRALSQIFIERVFSNPVMLKNKKYAQGSGVPIITAAGKEVLHRHFLEASMKILFLIETAHSHRVIPSLTRIFTKSSHFKSLNEIFSELTRELLRGSSADFKKAFSRIGFQPTYKQSFIEDYNYQATGFDDFSDGLILAKLIETVGELPYGQLLSKMRDPAGDRIRKINNVKTVLTEMQSIGIPTEDVTPAAIVGGKKEAVLSLLWSIVGVRVAKEKRVRYTRVQDDLTTPKKNKRRSGVHDDMSSEVLKALKVYGRNLNMEVLDLDSITDGLLLDRIWTSLVPNATAIRMYQGDTLWEKVVSMAELELGITRGLDQNVALFVKMFLERVQTVRMYNEKALKIQTMWRAYLERKRTPKLYFLVQQILHDTRVTRSVSPATDNATFVIQPRGSMCPTTPHSMNSTLNDATFTVSRDSIDSMNSIFKMPKTPLRGTFTRSTIAKHLNEVIEEEEMEEEEEEERDETVVPSTLKKRVTRSNVKKMVFRESSEDNVVTVESSKISMYSEVLEKGIKQEVMEEDSEDVKTSDGNELRTDDASQKVDLVEDVEMKDVEEEEEDVVAPVQEYNEVEKKPVVVKDTDDLPNPATQTTSNMEPAVNCSEIVAPPTPAPRTTMDSTQPRTSESTVAASSSSSTSSTEYQLSEAQQKENDILKSYIENQKKFVEKNKLDLVIKDPKNQANTPELRRILRETRELKRKQMEIAKTLGKIEKYAMAPKENEAFLETPSVSADPLQSSSDYTDRSDAGHDDAIIHYEESSTSTNINMKLSNLEKTVEFMKGENERKIKEEEEKRCQEQQQTKFEAAVIIQKIVRGFLARRRFHQEIQTWRDRMVAYNEVLAIENMQFERDEAKDSSVEIKLRNCALHGLTNENLHIVHIAATIIDRITDLVPQLVEKFVVEMNGVKLCYDILDVADQGYAYTAILAPILRIVQKSFHTPPEEATNEKILPILPQLSPRLFLLMRKHIMNREFFIPIITSLISIGRRFPNKKDSHLQKWENTIKSTMKRVTDPDCSKYLITLQTICDL